MTVVSGIHVPRLFRIFPLLEFRNTKRSLVNRPFCYVVCDATGAALVARQIINFRIVISMSLLVCDVESTLGVASLFTEFIVN